MQLYNGQGVDYALNIESDNGGTHHSADIPITPGATYWCVLKRIRDRQRQPQRVSRV